MIVAEKNSAVLKAFCRYVPVTSFRGNLRLISGRRGRIGSTREERKEREQRHDGEPRKEREERKKVGERKSTEADEKKKRESLVTRTSRIIRGLRLHLGGLIPKTGWRTEVQEIERSLYISNQVAWELRF